MGYINEGKHDGAEVVIGGDRLERPGYFVHPTVLAKVTPDMRVYQEEIFGPVVAVTPFDDDQEVFAMANNTIYGLAASAWTKTSRTPTVSPNDSTPAQSPSTAR